MCQRCLKFFQKFGYDYIYVGPANFATKERVKGNGLMFSFLNAFGGMGGFDAILNFIKFDAKDTKYVIIAVLTNLL